MWNEEYQGQYFDVRKLVRDETTDLMNSEEVRALMTDVLEFLDPDRKASYEQDYPLFERVLRARMEAAKAEGLDDPDNDCKDGTLSGICQEVIWFMELQGVS